MSLLLKNGQVYYKDKLQNLDILIENDQLKKWEMILVIMPKKLKIAVV